MRRLCAAALALLTGAALSCNDGDDGPTGPTTGALQVTLNMTGEELDPDGCQISLDGGSRRVITTGASVSFTGLKLGSHSVLLDEVASNCTVEEPNPRTVNVTAGTTTPVTFNVDCLKAYLIAFTTDRDGNSEIYVMNPDGSNPVNLTNHSAEDSLESWSPDGTQIAFKSDRGGSLARYVMNADGKEVSKLSEYAYGALSPDWTRMAWAEGDYGSGFKLYLMNVDGTGLVELSADWDGIFYPRWSPDGTRILFDRDDSEADCFSVIHADGKGYVFDFYCLTDATGANSGLEAWSPDGTRIVFSNEPVNDWLDDLFVMNADATGVVNVSNEAGAEDWGGVWSPDGARIAFLSDRDRICGIYLMNADGSDQRILAELSCEDTGLNRYGPPLLSMGWSPDGTRISFSLSDGEIYAVNIDGTGLVNLTDHPATDRSPEWRP